MRRFLVALGAALALLASAGMGTQRAWGQDVECDPGDQEVRSLEFEGNHAFSDAELALRIVTTPS